MNDVLQLAAALDRELLAQAQRTSRAQRLYDGTLPLAYLPEQVRKLFGDRLRPVGLNFARVLVDAVGDRLHVAGFRTAPGDPVDDRLTRLWRAAGLPQVAGQAMRSALATGTGFISLGQGPRGVVAAAGGPDSVIVRRDPLSGETVAALKRWTDVDGVAMAALATREQVATLQSSTRPVPAATGITAAIGRNAAAPIAAAGWEIVESLPNPLGRVPVVALVNRPRPDGTGEPDTVEIADAVQALSKLGSDAMTAAEAAAMPRRYVQVSATLTPEQAQDVQAAASETLLASGGSRVAVIGGGGDLRTLEASDLAAYRSMIETLTEQIAALAGLPSYWIRANTAAPTSADAIRAAEHRLAVKVVARQRWFTPALVEIAGLLSLADAGYDIDQPGLDVLWEDPRPASVAQQADAATKLVDAGILDQRAALEALATPPAEVERILAGDTK